MTKHETCLYIYDIYSLCWVFRKVLGVNVVRQGLGGVWTK